jgi:hypothetical protein
MKKLLAVALVVSAMAAVIGSCSKQSSEITVYPIKVGEKTDLYEAVADNALQLAEGVTFKVVPGPGGGQENGIVLMRPNGEIGGYVVCECIGATQGNCKTESDNPNHPSCTGGCTDSEGNPHGCMISAPLPGPPRDPTLIRMRSR